MNKRVIVIWTLILMLLVAPLFLRVASADTSSYDTCVDVDGDNRFVASYAIEFDMDTGQEEDRFYDVCLSNSQVREYLCTGGTYDDHAYSTTPMQDSGQTRRVPLPHTMEDKITKKQMSVTIPTVLKNITV